MDSEGGQVRWQPEHRMNQAYRALPFLLGFWALYIHCIGKAQKYEGAFDLVFLSQPIMECEPIRVLVKGGGPVLVIFACVVRSCECQSGADQFFGRCCGGLFSGNRLWDMRLGFN